jgi:hypothetical protein
MIRIKQKERLFFNLCKKDTIVRSLAAFLDGWGSVGLQTGKNDNGSNSQLCSKTLMVRFLMDHTTAKTM